MGDRLPPVRSGLDVGCGVGAWACAMGEQFAGAEIVGVDQGGAPREQFLISEDRFRAHDLTQSLDLGRRFDLCTSLEVAEHLDERYADQFVDTLIRHSDIVLFSAAAPRQGGTHHVNEQWPQYWAERFAAKGYAVLDIVRPLIWEMEGVSSWYKQNTVLYAKDPSVLSVEGLEDWGARAVVHPELWLTKMEPWRTIGRRFRKTFGLPEPTAADCPKEPTNA